MRVYKLSIALPLFILGCAHSGTTQTAEASPPGAAQPQQTVAVAPPVAQTNRCTSDDQCEDDELCQSGQCAAITAEMIPACLSETHFEFNEDLIRDQDKAHLQRTARCMNALPNLQVTVAGNCDERGTEEYNLALGDRRARAVAAYLESLGVPTSNVSTVSYGKLRPVCEAHVESCWQHNRRAALTRTDLSAQR
jgi:peptidoglycan-associated lipoprotein